MLLDELIGLSVVGKAQVCYILLYLCIYCSFWDDWIRQPEQRKDRACIRPEISRTATFGKNGVSKSVKIKCCFKNGFNFIFQNFISKKRRTIQILRSLSGCIAASNANYFVLKKEIFCVTHGFWCSCF